jgi:hypothetical protein
MLKIVLQDWLEELRLWRASFMESHPFAENAKGWGTRPSFGKLRQPTPLAGLRSSTSSGLSRSAAKRNCRPRLRNSGPLELELSQPAEVLVERSASPGKSKTRDSSSCGTHPFAKSAKGWGTRLLVHSKEIVLRNRCTKGSLDLHIRRPHLLKPVPLWWG